MCTAISGRNVNKPQTTQTAYLFSQGGLRRPIVDPARFYTRPLVAYNTHLQLLKKYSNLKHET